MSAFLAADLGLVPLGVSAERGLEGTCLSERDRKGGGAAQLGVSRRESQTLELVNATSFPAPHLLAACLPSWRLKAVGKGTDRQTVHT